MQELSDEFNTKLKVLYDEKVLELITEEDLEEIKSLFPQNKRNAKWIFRSLLLLRWREDLYSKLNIQLLFRILDELDDAEYERLVRPIFEESYGWQDEDLPIDNIASQIGEILDDNEDISKCPSVVNLAELLIYLFSISGRSAPFPAHDVFHSFALKNTDTAIGLLKKHAGTRSKVVASGIKDMLSILCRLKEEK